MHSNSGQLPSFCAVIVAAGQGLRAGQPIPKQFTVWNGKPVLRHSVEVLQDAELIVVAIPEGAEAIARECVEGIDNVRLVTGGATRQDSVRLALEAISNTASGAVLIHDAARPGLTSDVIARLLGALEKRSGAIPVLPVVDSMIRSEHDLMVGDAKRDELRRVQTPQAFRFNDILAAHRTWRGESNAGDDAQVLMAAGHNVALVDGDERLKKLTFAEDFMVRPAPSPAIRIGTGFDVHRLAGGEELWLCGIQIPHSKGLAGHSDADVGLHAVVDAILGACAQGDIGDHFPPGDPQWKGAPSARFVQHAVKIAGEAGWAIGNVDLTLICETPKIGPYREAMRARLAELLDVEISHISVKATTTEKLGFTGRGEGIAAQAAATLVATGMP